MNREARVSCGGFFAGNESQPPVRFEATTFDDGTDGWVMTVNDHFAHMSEEALRVVAAYEFNVFLAANEERFMLHGQTPNARVNGLMSVAFTLGHDLWNADEDVWSSFLEAYGLPEIDCHEIERWANRNGQDAGSYFNTIAYLDHLERENPDLFADLTAPDAGVWQIPRP